MIPLFNWVMPFVYKYSERDRASYVKVCGILLVLESPYLFCYNVSSPY